MIAPSSWYIARSEKPQVSSGKTERSSGTPEEGIIDCPVGLPLLPSTHNSSESKIAELVNGNREQFLRPHSSHELADFQTDARSAGSSGEIENMVCINTMVQSQEVAHTRSCTPVRTMVRCMRVPLTWFAAANSPPEGSLEIPHPLSESLHLACRTPSP